MGKDLGTLPNAKSFAVSRGFNLANAPLEGRCSNKGAANALSPEARRGQELVSQVTIKHMSYAHFAIAPNARPDASASANSAMFLVIKVPTRTAYRRTPNKFLENPAAHPPSPHGG